MSHGSAKKLADPWKFCIFANWMGAYASILYQYLQ